MKNGRNSVYYLYHMYRKATNRLATRAQQEMVIISFNELCKRVLTLTSICGWNLQELKDRIILTRSSHLFLLPEIELMIAKSLGYTIWIFRWRLLEDHDLYTNSLRATAKIISNLVKDLEKMHICSGVKPTERCCDVLPHVILKLPGDPLFDDPGPSFPHEEFWH